MNALPHPTIALLQSSSLATVVQQEIERAILAGEHPPGSKLIEAATIPLEGFRVLTAPNRVHLIGSTKALPYPTKGITQKHSPYANNGTAWAVAGMKRCGFR